MLLKTFSSANKLACVCLTLYIEFLDVLECLFSSTWFETTSLNKTLLLPIFVQLIVSFKVPLRGHVRDLCAVFALLKAQKEVMHCQKDLVGCGKRMNVTWVKTVCASAKSDIGGKNLCTNVVASDKWSARWKCCISFRNIDMHLGSFAHDTSIWAGSRSSKNIICNLQTVLHVTVDYPKKKKKKNLQEKKPVSL